MTSARRWRCVLVVLAAMLLAGGLAGVAAAQGSGGKDGDAANRQTADRSGSLFDFIGAGGIVGYVIILLSFVGVALVVDGFIHLREDKLIPSALVEQSQRIARQGKFSEVFNLCQANDSMISRIIRTGLAQWQLGGAAVRETMQEQGAKEVTHLQQRVGYIGFIASVAPMLGLLGTVVGMIQSFGVLGQSQGAARPDELATGIAKALVTTCMGLVVAVPLMFFFNYFRDRVTRIGQEASGACERLLRAMTAAVAARAQATGAAGPKADEPAGEQVSES